jgi:predicted metal-binding protein
LEGGGATLLSEGVTETARDEELAVREAECVCSCVRDEDGLGMADEVGVA